MMRIIGDRNILLAILVTACSLFFFHGAASADYNALPDHLPAPTPTSVDPTLSNPPAPHSQYINLSVAGSDDLTGAGAYVPATAFKIYSNAAPANTHYLYFHFYNVYDETTNCTGYTVFYQYNQLNDAEQYQGLIGSRATALNPDPATAPASPNYCTSVNHNPSGTAGVFRITVPANAFVASNLPDHAGLYVASINVDFGGTTIGSSQSSFFTVDSSNNSKVDYLGTYPATQYPKADKNVSNWGDNTIDATFRPNCTLDPYQADAPIHWRDDDYAASSVGGGTNGVQKDGGMTIKLYAYDDNGNAAGGPWTLAAAPKPLIAGSGGLVGYGPDGSGTFRPSEGLPGGKWKTTLHYKFEVSKISGGNGIEITLPFDSGDFEFNCQPPPTSQPSQTVTCNNVVVKDGGGATVGGTYYPTTRTLVARWGSNPDITVFPDVVANGSSKTYDYIATGQDDPTSNTNPVNGSPGDGGQDRVHLRLVRQYKDSSGNWQNYDTGNEDFYSVKCHQAQCVVNSVGVAGSRDDGRVVVGQQYTYYATVMNTGGPQASTLTPQLSGADLSLTINGIKNTILPNPSSSSTSIPPGGVAAFSFTSTALPNPDSSGHPYTATFGAYPDYYGGLGPLDYSGSCSTSFSVYVPFTLTPDTHATLTPDSESPDTLRYDATIANSSTANVYAPVYACIYRYKDPAADPAGCSSGVIHGTYNGGTYGGGTTQLNSLNGSDSLPLGSYNAGDNYCAYLHMDYTSGIVGPGGASDVVPSDGVTVKHPPCSGVDNEPYVHFTGSSVMAGGGFEGDAACTTENGAIHTYAKTTGSQARGSGVQFGAFALNVIEGLNSANLRTGPPTASTGLSFSNTHNANASGLPGAALGGQLGSYASCWPNYFGRKPVSTGTGSPALSASVGTAGAQYYTPASTFTLTGGSLGTGVSQTIYVEGKDVYINGSGITYAGASGWQNLTDIPSFMLVVKGGNIYIDKAVTQLDGIYVAQPDKNGAGGNINTCAMATGAAVPGSQIYGNACNKQLVVNGAFMAKKIFLNRSYSSLRYSQGGENTLYGATNHNCGNANLDVPAGATSATDCAAEIFNFSPEIYLTQPALDPKNGPATGSYDYVTSLSPVL